MFEKRSKVLFVCAVLATLYTIYLIVNFFGGTANAKDSAEAIGGAIATAIVMPHMVMMGLGAVFSWVGFGIKKAWGALVGAILYCVGLLFFPLYFMFAVPLIVLGFVGFSKQKNLSAQD